MLQRLAVQGAELEARDVIVGERRKETDNSEEEEWSVIDLKDEQSLINKDKSRSKNKSKSTVKQIKEAASVLGFGSSFQKLGKNKEQKSIFDQLPVDNNNNENEQVDENPFWNDTTHNETESETKSILMSASESDQIGKEKGKKPAFRGLFQADKSEEKDSKCTKRQWGFDGFKRWKKSNVEDETTSLPLSERSTDQGPYIQGPDAKHIKTKILSQGSSSGFYIDKVTLRNKKYLLHQKKPF